MSPDGPVIPFDRLPEGFARRLDEPVAPAVPRPAATIVLLREAEGAVEALLIRRARSAGFVPGAYVFPGGRVDSRDGDAEAVARLSGTREPELARRLGTDSATSPSAGQTPASAYLVAAIREAFEETGILLASTDAGGRLPSAAESAGIEAARRALLENEASFAEVLVSLGARMDGGDVGYIGHWITPEAEPRRYDTRFFAARVPRDVGVKVDGREITEGLWLSPAVALDRNRDGTLPMVFPTLKTLEGILSFSTPGDVLDHYREREIPAILPRFVRTPTGVGIRIPEAE